MIKCYQMNKCYVLGIPSKSFTSKTYTNRVSVTKTLSADKVSLKKRYRTLSLTLVLAYGDRLEENRCSYNAVTMTITIDRAHRVSMERSQDLGNTVMTTFSEV